MSAAKTVGRFVGYWLLRGAMAISPRVPLRCLLWIGSGLGDLTWMVSGRRRRIADRNLRIAFGRDLAPAERSRIARASFRHLGMFPFESMKFACMPDSEAARFIRVDDEVVRLLEEGFALGRGLIFVSAHYGNFELAARAVAMRGHPVVVVVRAARDSSTTDLMNRLRLRNGMTSVRRDVAARPMVSALRKGQCVAILADQNASDVFVPFFGQPTGTVDGPARISLHTGAPIIVGACMRSDSCAYRVLAEGMILPDTSVSRDDEIVRITTEINRLIERTIRRDPDQWLWLHNRWRSSPDVVVPED